MQELAESKRKDMLAKLVAIQEIRGFLDQHPLLVQQAMRTLSLDEVSLQHDSIASFQSRTPRNKDASKYLNYTNHILSRLSLLKKEVEKLRAVDGPEDIDHSNCLPQHNFKKYKLLTYSQMQEARLLKISKREQKIAELQQKRKAHLIKCEIQYRRRNRQFPNRLLPASIQIAELGIGEQTLQAGLRTRQSPGSRSPFKANLRSLMKQIKGEQQNRRIQSNQRKRGGLQSRFQLQQSRKGLKTDALQGGSMMALSRSNAKTRHWHQAVKQNQVRLAEKQLQQSVRLLKERSETVKKLRQGRARESALACSLDRQRAWQAQQREGLNRLEVAVVHMPQEKLRRMRI